MSNIYDDVEALQVDVETLKTQMTTVESQVAVLQVQTLAENTDLHALDIGTYLIPDATVAATLLNKPTTSTATGIVRVFEGGNSSQKIMQYVPCANVPTYYQCAYYSSAWTDWDTIDLSDSGWLDLPLASNVVAYSTGQKPQYRKIGKEVFVRGVYLGTGTGISVGSTIATLPEGYRPSQRLMKYAPGYAMGVDRLEIETSGAINLAQTTVATANMNSFHSLSDISFLID